MATTPLEFRWFTGQEGSLLVDLYDIDDNSLASDLSPSELTNGKGRYQVDYTGSYEGHVVMIRKHGSDFLEPIDYSIADNTTIHFPITIQAALDTVNGGSGLSLVTITVNDGVDPVVGATVIATLGATRKEATTNASGIAYLWLDDASWTIGITKNGFEDHTATLVVSGATSQTYSLTGSSISPSEAGKTTVFFYTYNEKGVKTGSISVDMRIFKAYSSSTGSYDSKIRTEISDASTAIVEFTNCFKGATYEVRRGSDCKWTKVVISADAGATTELPDPFIGIDE